MRAVGVDPDQRRASQAADGLVEDDEPEADLGHDPHADRELAPAEPEHDDRDRDRERARDERAEHEGGIDADALVHELDREIGAEAEERLLADGDEAA